MPFSGTPPKATEIVSGGTRYENMNNLVPVNTAAVVGIRTSTSNAGAAFLSGASCGFLATARNLMFTLRQLPKQPENACDRRSSNQDRVVRVAVISTCGSWRP